MTQRLIFDNSKDITNILIVEPWAREFLLEKDKALYVEVDYTSHGDLIIQLADNRIIIHAWETCAVLVKDGTGNIVENGDMIQRSL